MKYVWCYLLLINVVTFIIYGVDKRKAQKDRWRIPEKVLFLFPLLGGSIGGILGMQVFRHKTKHWYFRIGLPLILVVQLALVAVRCYIALR